MEDDIRKAFAYIIAKLHEMSIAQTNMSSDIKAIMEKVKAEEVKIRIDDELLSAMKNRMTEFMDDEHQIFRLLSELKPKR